MKKIPRFTLKENEDPKDFVKNNKLKFWEMILEATQQLKDNPSIEKYPAFILIGGKLEENEEFLLDRSKILQTLNKGIKELEELEEYELCSDVLEYIKFFEE